MKKFLYLCLLITICLDLMSQIDPYDKNWDTIFYDDFSTFRTWDSIRWRSHPDTTWKALAGNGITHGNSGHEKQLYQYNNCIFNTTDNTVQLVSKYDWEGKIPSWNYSIPESLHGVYPNLYGQNASPDGVFSWYYFSGEIDVNDQLFGFGYFEIRCKLPIHKGSFPAFWLFGNGPHQYEEIDIFEYSEDDSQGDSLRGYSSGIWFNPNSTNHPTNYFKNTYHLTDVEPDLGQYHTFGCEWMPDYVRLYRDGKYVNEYQERQYIPKYPKSIRINYALNENSLNSLNMPNGWSGTDVMTIDYVKVCYLKLDCNTAEIINCQSYMDSFDYAVKKSITMSTTNLIKVRDTDHITFRVTDFFQDTGPFQVEYGGEFTVIVQECPNNYIIK